METQQNLNPTPATEWQGKVQVEGADVLLPSGNVARCRQISPQAFISDGIIPDPLLNIIRQAINTKKGLPPQTMKKITEDKSMLAQTLLLFDRVLSYVAIEPKIEMPPKCTECAEYFMNGPHNRDTAGANYHAYNEGAREGGVLYADQVILDDKVFIFNWCLGGTKDLAKFRAEQQSRMGDLLDGEDVPVKAKRAARRK